MACRGRHSRTGDKVLGRQPAARKLLYRRRGLSPPFSPRLSPPFSPPLDPGSPSLSHVTYPSLPIIPRPREGHRRRFDEADKRRILDEAARPGTSVPEVARRYGIDRRILCRWKRELSPPA